ncbi:MAG: hypothetical protein ACT4O6_06030 [Reyranella sp.]
MIEKLRPFRSANSYVGGGAALNQRWPRLSDDMDIFIDQRKQLPRGPYAELEVLRQAGFSVDVTTRDEVMVEAIVKQYGEETRIQWIDEPETSKRFFPAANDEELGYRLHQADAAVNKALCAARRERAPRDAVDLVSIVRRYAPLGPLVWALVGKDSNLTPPKAISSIRRIAFGYADEEIRAVRMEEGGTVTREELRRILEPALEAAAAYCDDRAPVDHVGCLFVDAGNRPVEATAITLADGSNRAIKINDFGSVPKLRA